MHALGKHSRFFSGVVFVLCAAAFFSMSPVAVFAADGDGTPLVPCGNGTNPLNSCNFCELLNLADNIIDFFMTVVVPSTFTLLVMYAGFLYLSASVKPGNAEKAKGMFLTAVIGFLWVIFAYFVISLMIQILARPENGRGFQFIHDFRCADVQLNTPDGRVSAGAAGTSLIPGAPSASVPSLFSEGVARTKAEEALEYDFLVKQYVNSHGEGTVTREQILAMIGIESDGNAGVTGRGGEIGLLQIKPEVARDFLKSHPQLMRDLDFSPDFNPDDLGAVRNVLRDARVNIALGVSSIASNRALLLGKPPDAVYAFHNGGLDALAPSADCSGKMKYQCIINPGELAGTQRYIENAHLVVSHLR